MLARRRTIRKVNLTPCFLLLAILVVLPHQIPAEEPIAHPLIEQKDIKSETCLKCHPEKKQGKFVHSAVAMGCENCHEASKDPVQHGPYKNGQCLICHDPHCSEFKAQTRAVVNSLCLACHALRQ